EIKYYTEGCYATRACAAMAAKLAEGKTVKEVLLISAGEVIAELKGLPEIHLHCSILAVSTLYRAIADYLLKK
ncbi:MAG: iron-sulfur cluster assembly scaffold protein, partial [Candidatus Omnitrophota bacterium]